MKAAEEDVAKKKKAAELTLKKIESEAAVAAALAVKEMEFNQAQKAAQEEKAKKEAKLELASLLLRQLETCKRQVNEAKTPKARAKAEKKLLETKKMIAEDGIFNSEDHHQLIQATSSDESSLMSEVVSEDDNQSLFSTISSVIFGDNAQNDDISSAASSVAPAAVKFVKPPTRSLQRRPSVDSESSNIPFC